MSVTVVASPTIVYGDTTRQITGFIETFDEAGWTDRWFVSNFDRQGSFVTGWRRRLASVHPPDTSRPRGGFLQLDLIPSEKADQKPFFGAEVQRSWVHYGSYEVYMQAGRGDGLVSAMFTYTGPFFGDPHDEVDFEFLGRDTTKVWLNMFTDGDNLPGRWLDLGFDAANAPHLYRFDWHPESVTWYVDGREIMKVTSQEHPIPSTPSKLFLQIWAGTPKMVEWLKRPADDLRAEATYYCVSYRPFEDIGRTCSDYVQGADD